MNKQHNKPANSNPGRNSIPDWVPSGLLFASGIALGVGYTMHLAGFVGWVTLVIGGLSLFAAGALWGDLRRFTWLAVGVILIGVVLCTSALPDQLRANAMFATAANLGVILSQLTAISLIWHITNRGWRMPLHRT